jgi:predicted GTPase
MKRHRQKVAIMGAAGRDFHNFNMVYRNSPEHEVIAFTAAQIPFIEKRIYPPELAGPLYPQGIPIFPEEKLEELITAHSVGQVVFAYSDVSHEYVMHRASLCLARGAGFVLLGPDSTMLRSARPLISVCAVRTGCGKSGVTRYILRILRDRGRRPVAIRHPMPYCDLLGERAQRFGSLEDLRTSSCTIEEREEFEPLVEAGVPVYVGVDYEEVLRRAEEEAEILVWDGGNNDLPFIRPDLELVVLDPHRPGHELAYHPGEANLRRAGVAIVNKVDTADRKSIEQAERNIRSVNPRAVIVRTASRIIAQAPERIRGRRVLVVEDGPTLTHGGMRYGAGVLAARKWGASEIVDPRPFAVGSIREVFSRYPHLRNLLPAMGYAAEQMGELKETIETVPCDLVLVATPVDLMGLLELRREAVRITYEIEEAGKGPGLKACIEGFLDKIFPS